MENFKVLRCDDCGIIFLSAYKLFEHRKRHIIPHLQRKQEKRKRFRNGSLIEDQLCTTKNVQLTLKLTQIIENNHLELGTLECHSCSYFFDLDTNLKLIKCPSLSPNSFQKFTYTCLKCSNCFCSLMDFVHYSTRLNKQKLSTQCRNCRNFYDRNVKYVESITKCRNLKTFQCNICYKRFSAKQLLNNHSYIHTGERPHVCKNCGRSFRHPGHLYRHTKCHSKSNKKMFNCDLCPKKYADKQNLKYHKEMHSGTKPHICTYCEKGFALPTYLKRHMKIHFERPEENKRYKCGICPKRFETNQLLRYHTYVHTGEKPYKCSDCNKKFAQMSHLRRHERVHSEDKKPFKCKVCPKAFGAKRDLRVHMYVHTGETPFKCHLCSDSFNRKNRLKTHLKTHSRNAIPKPFKCSVCGKAYSRKDILRYHMFSHTGERPYKCTLCEEKFTHLNYLRRHLVKAHS